jgi:hypothetical protein
MNTAHQTTDSPFADRVTSVDFFRGFTMFLLAGEATMLYEHFFESHNGIMHFYLSVFRTRRCQVSK